MTIKVELAVTIKQMEETLLNMGFKIFVQEHRAISNYLNNKYGMGQEIEMEEAKKLIKLCENKFVQDGERGPVVGPLEDVFTYYYRDAIFQLMKGC